MADPLSQTLSARCFLPNDHSLHPAKSDSPWPTASSKRGRPRMAPGPDNDSARMDRRAQVRYAQRTYRHKKEVMYRNMEKRLAELERTMSRLTHSISDFHDMAVESDLHITHPQLFEHLRVTLDHATRVTGAKQKNDLPAEADDPVVFPSGPTSKDASSFGYIVDSRIEADGGRTYMFNQQPDPGPNRQSQSFPQRSQVEHPLPGSTKHTYSFHEPDPSRMLHRYCLEYVYRLFSDPRSNPEEFYRVFRLVPCVKYREKMGSYLLCLVRSSSSCSLEFPALPFYCIGGAGTHYPEIRDGKPVYPANMRLPRRILGTVVSLCSGGEISSIDRQQLLRLAGLDGTWLDCRDVIGYLQQKGVLDGNASSAPGTRPSERVAWTLDIHSFFRSILANMVVLGRSPGFRFGDVERAFTANLRSDSK